MANQSSAMGSLYSVIRGCNGAQYPVPLTRKRSSRWTLLLIKNRKRGGSTSFSSIPGYPCLQSMVQRLYQPFLIGLFYGYVFVKTKSLLPSMIVHYLSNVFIGSLTGYLQSRGSIQVQALYGILFSFGILPTTLMILWTSFYTTRWMPSTTSVQSSPVNLS